ncbi:MAG TPA: ABC transporter substrate-binding protein, partial [Accumulibacter sp.]|nr:ABC transporter substrate-binding protein [Accumulibacter sp.]
MLLFSRSLFAGEPVTVQLNWKHQFEFAAFYAAESKGFYKDAGLDVSIKEGGPGIDVVNEVIAGRADFGVGASS